MELTHADAPGLFQLVEELCAKAGIPMQPILDVTKHCNTMLQYSPAAAIASRTKDSSAIVVNSRMLRAIEPSLDFANYHSVQREVSGWLAHEIGHLKRRDMKLPFGKYVLAEAAPWVGACGAIAALGLIDYSHRTRKAMPDREDVKQYTTTHFLDDMFSPSIDWMGKIVQYMLVGLGGFAAGKVGAVGLHHHMEFGADRFSKELLGSGEPMARALEKIERYGEGLAHELHSQKGLNEQQITAAQKIDTFFRLILHPSSERRIAELRR